MMTHSNVYSVAGMARCSIYTAFAFALGPSVPAHAQWSQWGGPNRDFKVEAKQLAHSWPDAGPKTIWKKQLGEGFSSIICDEGVLYTMYRNQTAPIEHVVALDAKTGEVLWDRESASPVPEAGVRFPGPHSTPIVSGNRVFAVGRNAVLRSYDKSDGKVIWSRNLVQDYGATLSEWGYSPSPLIYNDLVILPVARKRPNFNHRPASSPGSTENRAEGRTLMAFKASDGELAWKTQDFGIDHSSPILITVGGRDQVVQVTPEAMFGVDPTSGDLVWTETFDRPDGFMVTPVWVDSRHLFYSTPNNGTRAISVSEKDGKVVSDRMWESRKLRMTFTNPVSVGDCIVGSTGQAPSLIVCLARQTGKRAWVERGFELASFVASGNRIIILEQSGRLSLATVTPTGLQIHSQFKVAEPECYTTPTLIDTTLYLRNRKEIMALDMG